jgi:hypothetical protein
MSVPHSGADISTAFGHLLWRRHLDIRCECGQTVFKEKPARAALSTTRTAIVTQKAQAHFHD